MSRLMSRPARGDGPGAVHLGLAADPRSAALARGRSWFSRRGSLVSALSPPGSCCCSPSPSRSAPTPGVASPRNDGNDPAGDVALLAAPEAIPAVELAATATPTATTAPAAPTLPAPAAIPSPTPVPTASLPTPPPAPPTPTPTFVPAPAVADEGSVGGGPRDALLPAARILTYYGHPHDENMGILGEYEIEELHRLLLAEADNYAAADPSRPVIPAFEVIATVAPACPRQRRHLPFSIPTSKR